MVAIPKVSKRVETSLASALSAAGSSFTLESATDEDGNALSGLYGMTIDVGNSNVEDFVVTVSGSTATVVYRGIDADDPVTEVAGNKKAHRRGAPVVITDYPIIAYLRNILAGESGYTLPALLKQAATVGNPVDDNDLARKAYVDSVVAGSYPSNRIVVAGTAGATIADGNLIYFDDTDNEWKLCDADTAATVDNVILGIAQGAGTDGGAISNGVLLLGLDDAQSGLTAGAPYYASNTAGGISASPGTKEVTVGFAYNTTSLYFNPRFNQQLTEDEQDALAGTSGTPSNSNKFVTNDDTAENTASKLVRRKSDSNVTVPTTPTASTDAASKAYVEAQDALLITRDKVPNTDLAFSSFFTQLSRIDADLGWTITGTPTFGGNWVSIEANADNRAFIALYGKANDHNNILEWNSGIDLRIAYLMTNDQLSTGTTPSGGGDIWYFHGLGPNSSPSTIGDITDVTRRAGFAHYNGRIYAVTANGTNVETTDIQADVADTKRHFVIDFTSTQVRYYINGTLVATHTTRVPNDANNMGLSFGGYDSSGGVPGFGMSGSIIISETLS